MAATVEKTAGDLATLQSTVNATSALIVQLLSTTATTEASAAKENECNSKIDALKLSHDSASLIRAHSTKLSLLIINKPFTPTAISTVLRELGSGPLPGLASAVQLCQASRYTKVMSKELEWRAKRTFTEVGNLVRAIPLNGQILSADQKNGTGGNSGKGSLAVTGVVWEACDAVLGLQKLGVAGLMIKRAEEYRDLVKDALEELQEWGEEDSDTGLADDVDEDSRSDGGMDNESRSHTSKTEATDFSQAALDSMFDSQPHIPSDDPDKIQPRLDSSQKRLRLIVLMYQAVIKRRLKTLPAIPHPALPPELKAKSNEDPGIVSCLDELLEVFKSIPDITDELANAFYELDSTEIDKRMDECFFKGFAAVELLIKNWEGEQDEFTIWARKFQIAMKKGW